MTGNNMFASFLFLALCWARIASNNSEESLLNADVITTIDISGQLVKVYNEIKATNIGNVSVDGYVHVVDPHWASNLSYIHAKMNKGEGDSLKTERMENKHSWTKYKIEFKHPIRPKQTVYFKIETMYYDILKSYPSTVEQFEKHLVLFSTNTYFYSCYYTRSQVTYVYPMKDKVVQSIVGTGYEFDERHNKLIFVEYTYIEPFSENITIIHFETQTPFLKVVKLERFVQISHWGSINVWEYIDLNHTGPKLKGPFERLHQIDPRIGLPTTMIESWTTTLPSSARNVYLKDEIGVISSFKTTHFYEKVTVHIKPRHVLFGGWQTKYQIGYTLNISDYIGVLERDKFFLQIPIAAIIFSDMIIEEAIIRVILPEGAELEEMLTPKNVEHISSPFYCTYFDTSCRRVVSFKMPHHLVESNLENVQLIYSFSTYNLLLKPLVLLTSIFVIFISFVIIVRLDFTINRPKPRNATVEKKYPIPMLGAKKKSNSLKKKPNKLYHK